MQTYRVLEHTADVGFEAYGSTREEVFANSARALVDMIVDLANIQAREEARIELEAGDSLSLLVNWLSEILYRFDAEGWLYRDFEFRLLDDRLLRTAVRGEKFDRARHRVKLQVKAVTYHQLALEPTPEGWRARVFLDI
jgi:SHS2 domain-containing protein